MPRRLYIKVGPPLFFPSPLSPLARRSAHGRANPDKMPVAVSYFFRNASHSSLAGGVRTDMLLQPFSPLVNPFPPIPFCCPDSADFVRFTQRSAVSVTRFHFFSPLKAPFLRVDEGR